MKGRLIALSSAAVLAVYTAGYARTRSAAELLEAEERRPPMPRPGAQDRTPIPAAPAEARLIPAAGAPASAPDVAAASTARGTISEEIDKSRRNPEATPERRLRRTIVDMVAAPATSKVEGASAPAAPAPAVAQVASVSDALQAPRMPEAPAAAPVQAPNVAAAPAASESSSIAAAPAPVPAAPAASKWKDGRYTGWGTSRHGDLQATVLVENGKIATASISQCLTRYPCDWIRPLPPQVVQRQSALVDYVSGATESTNAFYYAILQALGKAEQ